MANTYFPTIVNQLGEEPNIAWLAVGYDGNTTVTSSKKIRTSMDLKHIANPASGPIRDSTNTLIYTGFEIPNLGTISGIELRIVGQRNGRISDETIQLTYQDSAIGRNNFYYETDEEGRLPLFNDTVYGGPEDLWGSEITADMLQDPSFGVILKFQSHPYYPHSSGMIIETVSLTVY
jgi:hypothetical protein